MPDPVPHGDEDALSAEGFILAGGYASRFGSDKSLALLDQRPLIALMLDLFASVGLTARIAGARGDALAGFAPIIPDEHPASGPLSGIHAGLRASSAEWSVFLPVDMPLIPSALLFCLQRRARLTRAVVTCQRVSGRLQPFPVVLHCSALPAVTAALAQSSGCSRLWQSFAPGQLDAPCLESLLQSAQLPADPITPSLWLHSANTQADLALMRYFFALRAKSRTLEM